MKSLKSLFLSLFILLLCQSSMYSQEQADSVRFRALRDSLVISINNRELDKAIELGTTLYNEATEKENHLFRIDALYEMHRTYNRMSNKEKSLELMKKALFIAEKNDLHPKLANMSGNLALAFFRFSDYDSATFYFQKAVDVAREHVPDRLAINLSNLAWINGLVDDREKEFEAYLASLKALEENPDSYRANTVMAMNLGGIGDYYVFTRDFEKAKEFFERKLQLGKDLDNLRMQFEAHGGLGNLYRMDEFYDFEKSRYHYEVTAFTEEIEVAHYKYQARQSLAKLYRKEGRYDQSLVYFRQVYDYYTSIEADDFRASAATAIGELYLELNNLTEANRWLTTAIEATISNNLIARERDALWSLYKVDSLRGRYRSSLERYQRWNQIVDSLSNERSKDRINELEIQFETEQTEKENLTLKSDLELKQAQVERQQIVQVLVTIVALTFIVLATIVFRNFKRKKKDNEIISQQANELKTLSRFKDGLTSMVVHDMRNPLNAILGFSQGTPTDDKLRNINRSGHQVLNLVNNMLDIQRFEEAQVELNPETINAKELVTLCIQEVSLLVASKSLRVINRVPEGLRFRIDPVLINRVLVNLLINSVKYSKSGTEIVVEVGQGSDGFQQLVVRDEGHGIPPEQLPHIFDKFWHNDPERSGVLPSTGLGLSFCKMAVEAHGGSIYAESVHHEGTSVFFALPLAAGAEEVETLGLEQEFKESVLNDEDLEIYRQYLPELESLEVFEVSEINKLIKAIEVKVNDKQMGRQLRTAAFQSDQSLYDQLLDQIREKNIA